MVRAYILTVVKPGTETAVAAELVKMSQVEDIDIVYGEFDIIFKVNVADMEELRNFIIGKLRKIADIERTDTVISVN